MKRFFSLLFFSLILSLPLLADHVDVCWPMGNQDDLGAFTLTEGFEGLLTPTFQLGSKLSVTGVKTASDAAEGYTSVPYDPVLVMLTPATRVVKKTSYHQVTYKVKVASDHTFKPTMLEFDAAKCGTDGGNFDVYIKNGINSEQLLEVGVAPLRNKVGEGNPMGKSHHSYRLSNQLVQGNRFFYLILYVYTHDRATEIEHRLKDRFGKQTHVTLHMEPTKNK